MDNTNSNRAVPPQAKSSLSAEINAGTRSLHTQLNRLITSRLPLCLPPYSHDPTIYALGLRHFAHIFLTFESLFADISATYPPVVSQTMSSPPASPRLNNPALSALLADPYAAAAARRAGLPQDNALLVALGALLPPEMLRSAALHTDLTTLHRTTPVTLSVALSRFPSPAVQDFVTHVRAIVADRPHVLVAYAWVFYMALFSGGRWIRAKLVEAGGDFWQQDGLPGGCYNLDGAAARQRAPATSNEVEDEEDWSQGNEGEVEGFSRDGGKPLDEAGLSFLFFPGGNDGEDIKAEFKARLAAAENLLSVSEREEVVEEAREIFRRCIELVHELDEIMGTPVDLLDLRPLKSTKASQGLTSSQAEVAQGLGISNVIANAADFRVRYSLSKPRRLWLDAAGRIGTVMVLSSVAWFAAHHLRDLVLDSDAWINVWPILR